jgi:hypothetical protein
MQYCLNFDGPAMHRFDVTKWARSYNWFTFENWLTENIGPRTNYKQQSHNRFLTLTGDGWELKIVYGKRPHREQWNIVQTIVKIGNECDTAAVMFKLQWM